MLDNFFDLPEHIRETFDIKKKDIREYSPLSFSFIGDCVYAIYTTPFQKDIYNLYYSACYCNTYIIMLNKLLKENNLPTIKAGIGLGVSQTLVIKAGREHVGINDKIWIGEAVIDASNLSSIANKDINNPIVISPVFYNNIIETVESQKKFFKYYPYSKYGPCYAGNTIITEFNDWINNGMKD